MDNIWDGNPSKAEVIGHCGRDGKKRMTTQNRQSRTLNKNLNNSYLHTIHVSVILNNLYKWSLQAGLSP